MVRVRAKRIFCVVAYDVEDNRCRNQIAKLLEKYGVRINYSVFECMFTATQYEQIREQINRKIKKQRATVVFYPICVNCFTKIIYDPDRLTKRNQVEIL